MIKPTDVLRQLIRRLPFETDRFSNVITFSNLRIENGILKFNAQNYPYYTIRSLKMLNPCVGAYSSGITRIATVNNHKFTNPILPKDVYEIETDVGIFTIHRVVDRNTIDVIGNASASNFLKEKIIKSAGLVVNSGLISGEAEVILSESSYNCNCEGEIASPYLNINIVPTTARMVDHYASKAKNINGLWAYIIFGDRNTISKPTSDAGLIMTAKGVQVEILKVSTDFDIYVWWPTLTNQEAAKKQQDESFDEVYNILNRCLFGQINDTTGIDGYLCAPKSNGIAEAETLSNYIHRYGFLALDEINYADCGQRQEVDHYSEHIGAIDFGLFIQAGDDAPQEMKVDIDNFRS